LSFLPLCQTALVAVAYLRGSGPLARFINGRTVGWHRYVEDGGGSKEISVWHGEDKEK